MQQSVFKMRTDCIAPCFQNTMGLGDLYAYSWGIRHLWDLSAVSSAIRVTIMWLFWPEFTSSVYTFMCSGGHDERHQVSLYRCLFLDFRSCYPFPSEVNFPRTRKTTVLGPKMDIFVKIWHRKVGKIENLKTNIDRRWCIEYVYPNYCGTWAMVYTENIIENFGDFRPKMSTYLTILRRYVRWLTYSIFIHR